MLNRSAASGCEDESMPEQSPLLSVGTKRRGTDPPPELCESLDDSEGAPKRRQGEPWQYEVTNPLCVQTEKEIKTELYDEDNAELNVKKENDLYEDYPDKFEDNFDPYEELFSCIMKATDPFEENRLLHREFQLLPSKKIYPDYYHMIEHPIDLKLIEQKIQTSAYESLNEIEKDLLQMTRNARIFNEPDSQIYKDAENLAKLIAAKMLEIGSGRAGTTVFKKSELMMSTMAASLKAEPDSSNDESENSKKSGGDGPLWQLFNQLYNAASESDHSNETLGQSLWNLPIRLHHPEYYEQISNPISMAQIQNKLVKGDYVNLSDLTSDLYMMLDNAKKGFPPIHRIHKDAVKMLQIMNAELVGDLIRLHDEEIPISNIDEKEFKLESSNVFGSSEVSFDVIPSFLNSDSATSPIKSRPLSTKGKPKANKAKVITGFILYSSEVRRGISQSNPTATFGEISRMVGFEWQNLPTDVKHEWQNKATRCNEESAATFKSLGQHERTIPNIDLKEPKLEISDFNGTLEVSLNVEPQSVKSDVIISTSSAPSIASIPLLTERKTNTAKIITGYNLYSNELHGDISRTNLTNTCYKIAPMVASEWHNLHGVVKQPWQGNTHGYNEGSPATFLSFGQDGRPIPIINLKEPKLESIEVVVIPENIGPASFNSDVMITSSPALSKAPKPLSTERKGKAKRAKVVSGYILYSSDVRTSIYRSNPSATFGEISRIVGAEWRNLPSAVKQTWQDKAAICNRERSEKCLPVVQNEVPTLKLNLKEPKLENSASIDCFKVPFEVGTKFVNSNIITSPPNIYLKEPQFEVNDINSLLEVCLDVEPKLLATPLTQSSIASKPLVMAFERKPKTNKVKVINGYILFAKDVRNSVSRNNPTATFGEISRLVGAEWRNLPSTVQQAWQDKANKCNKESASSFVQLVNDILT